RRGPPRPSRGAPVSWAALRADALACHAAALAAVEPGRLVARSLERAGGALRLRGRSGAPVAEHAGRVLVVGAGKAALAMARAAAEILGGARAGGLVVVPHGGAGPCPGGIEVAPGGPRRRSLDPRSLGRGGRRPGNHRLRTHRR